MDQSINAINNMAQSFISGFLGAVKETMETTVRFARAMGFGQRSTRRWVMMAKNGQNTKERKRNQVMLKGRGCRTHKGGYPTRGKGRTTRSKGR